MIKRCKEHNKLTGLTICSHCILEIKQQAKKEVFDDFEKHPDWKRLGLYCYFEEVKKRHLSQKEQRRKT